MKAAIYESDITPPLGCYLTGYGFDRRAKEVYNKLFAKSLVIEQDGKYAVIISVDICEYPPEISSVVTRRIEEYTGIKPECVCIHSTHTHRGAPVTDDPSINCFGDNSYKDVFSRLVADSAILAFNRLDEAVLSFASVMVPGIAHCRCSVLKDGTLKTFVSNPDLIERPISEPDHEVPILFVEQNGKKIGALYCFGCHQDTYHPETVEGYTGDYSSFVSEHLKDAFGRDFVSIYLAAPSGDINNFNPFAKNDSERSCTAQVIAEKISSAILSVKDNEGKITGKLKVFKEKINIAKRKYDSEAFYALAKQYVDSKSLFALSNLVYYKKTDFDEYAELYVQVIAIGDFALYIYPGEMFCEYSHRTKKNSLFKYNMVVENCNAYGGYIPVPEAFGSGSKLYEIAPAYDSFCEPNAGDILYEKIMQIAKEIKNSD